MAEKPTSMDWPQIESSTGLGCTPENAATIRLSLFGSSGSFASTYSSRLPLPLVSTITGVQPCDFASSPVSSYILVLSQPTTPLCGPPAPAPPPRRSLPAACFLFFFFGVDPADDAALRPARAGPQRVVGVVAEVEVMGRKAGADERPLIGLRVVHR